MPQSCVSEEREGNRPLKSASCRITSRFTCLTRGKHCQSEKRNRFRIDTRKDAVNCPRGHTDLSGRVCVCVVSDDTHSVYLFWVPDLACARNVFLRVLWQEHVPGQMLHKHCAMVLVSSGSWLVRRGCECCGFMPMCSQWRGLVSIVTARLPGRLL